MVYTMRNTKNNNKNSISMMFKKVLFNDFESMLLSSLNLWTINKNTINKKPGKSLPFK